MRSYAFVDTEGHTQYTISSSDETGITAGEIYSGNLCLEIPKDEDQTYYIENVYYDHDLKEWQPKPPCPGVEFYRWIDKSWKFMPNLFFAKVRAIRDEKIAASDWTVLPDSPLSAAEKADWAAYRQALRDFPATITTETTLEELVWPTAP